MPIAEVRLRPGVFRDSGKHPPEGAYYDCNRVRFRNGYPEQIGGWQKINNTAFLGVSRSVLTWSDLTGNEYLGAGTHLKFYIESGNAMNDITPIRKTVNPMSNDPFTTGAASSTTITVSDTAHGAVLGDYVTFSGATGPIDGIAASEFNIEHEIKSIIDDDSYTIDTATGCTAGSTAGGGAAVVAAYQINVGLDSVVLGSGWGAGTYSRGAWGSGANVGAISGQLRLWSQGNWGEDLIFNVRDGEVYYWDESSGLSTRGVELSTMSGASDVPSVAVQILISPADRHLIAFGCDPIETAGSQDRMFIRWADQESAVNWTPAVDTTAGGIRLNSGSEILRGITARQEILIFTDSALYSMQYLGAPFVFGADLLSENITLMGPNAVATAGDATAWMGLEGFWIYSGRILPLPCEVHDYVFDNINRAQAHKIVAGYNSRFSEFTWHYPSVSSDENDVYVTVNISDGSWYYGSLARTAWTDTKTRQYPVAAGTDGFIYDHEFGLNDGSTTPVSALNSYVEGHAVPLAGDDRFAFVRRILPDVSFTGSTAASPQIEIVLKPRRFPGGGFGTASTNSVTRTATVPFEEFDGQKHVRVRGRSISFRYQCSQTDTHWRAGDLLMDARPDGRQ